MIEVRYSKSASFTPAFALIAEGWNELVQSGLTSEGRGDAPFDASSEVLYAEQPDGEVVGDDPLRRVEGGPGGVERDELHGGRPHRLDIVLRGVDRLLVGEAPLEQRRGNAALPFLQLTAKPFYTIGSPPV